MLVRWPRLRLRLSIRSRQTDRAGGQRVSPFTDAELGIETPAFPCEYRAPGTWGWSVDDAWEFYHHFLNRETCHLPNPHNPDVLLRTKSVAYCGDVRHTQCYGGYQGPDTPPNTALVKEQEEDHCHGPLLPSSQAPECVRKLQKVLNGILHTMPGYEHHQINYLSVMQLPGRRLRNRLAQA
jgi:hypothetical protein